MPALLKLSRSIENFRDALRSQPPTYDKKKNYVYKRVVGKGTFGKVLHAVWNDPAQLNEKLERRCTPKPAKRDVALKVVKKSTLKRGDKNVVLFEVDILRRLNHKNVVRFYEFFESCRNYYISFEYAAGGELYERIKQRGGRYTEVDAKECVRSILHGVEYLHGIGIIHHDLKPENILFRSKGHDAEVVLADFGAARHVESPDSLVFCDTGTYDYSPPEIFTREGHGFKLDMWAVGVITYAILSGMMPFPNRTLAILRTSVLRCELAFEGRYWEKVSETAKEFVRALIHADQKARLSASEALEHPWLTGSGETKPSEDTSQVHAQTQARKHKTSIKKGEEEATTVTTTTVLTSTSTDRSSEVPVEQDSSISSSSSSRQVARARWRIAMDSAIAINRFCEAGKSRAESRSRRRTEELERYDSEFFGYGYGYEGSEYDDCDSELANNSMSQISLALESAMPSASTSMMSLSLSSSPPGAFGRISSSSSSASVLLTKRKSSNASVAAKPRGSLEEEANSPEQLRELKKLVRSGVLEDVKKKGGCASSFGSLTKLSGGQSSSSLIPSQVSVSPQPQPPSQSQPRLYTTLRPPSPSPIRAGSPSRLCLRGWPSSTSSGSSRSSASSASSGSTDRDSPSSSRSSSILSSNLSHSTAATSIVEGGTCGGKDGGGGDVVMCTSPSGLSCQEDVKVPTSTTTHTYTHTVASVPIPAPVLRAYMGSDFKMFGKRERGRDRGGDGERDSNYLLPTSEVKLKSSSSSTSTSISTTPRSSSFSSSSGFRSSPGLQPTVKLDTGFVGTSATDSNPKPTLSLVIGTSTSTATATATTDKINDKVNNKAEAKDPLGSDSDPDPDIDWQHQWRTPLSEISPELESSLRSFRARW